MPKGAPREDSVGLGTTGMEGLMLNGFTRQEVIKLTGASPGNLSYLDETNLVRPYKEGNPKRPKFVIFSTEQLLQIQLIEKLRGRFSLQEIRKVIRHLNERSIDSFLWSQLFMVGNQVCLVDGDCELGRIVRDACNESNPLVVREVGVVGYFLLELANSGATVLDFQKRIEGTLIEKAVKDNQPQMESE